MNAHLTVRGRRLALATALTACVIPIGRPWPPRPRPRSPGATVSMAGTAKAQTVRYGKTVSIAGRVAPGGSGRAVRLEYAAGKGGYRQVAASRTAADGSYSFTPAPAVLGLLPRRGRRRRHQRRTADDRRGQLAGRAARHVAGHSPRERARQAAARPGGRRVRLQLRTRGGWRTVDRDADGPARALPRVVQAAPAGATACACVRRRPWPPPPSDRLAQASGSTGPATRPGTARACTATHGLRRHALPRARSAWRTSRCRAAPRSRSATAAGRSPCAVVDRGPYVGGREWDLTAATKARLGFGWTGTVWSTR